ncbi:hypothetical protein [Catellatospora sp. NPDC049609]|uniref:hypothetical protein n=1 Tax=Catellatospora sp. NPDC049609 TaxID=3155505 RepID=UPI003412585E
MARKSTWITAGVLSAAAASAAAVLVRLRRRDTAAEDNLRALADFEPHPQNGKHKKERLPRKLKKHLHAEAGAGHGGGQHW